MTPSLTRKLLSIHRVSGLIVSANMILFALTGIVLVFHEEIDAALGVVPQSRQDERRVSLARAVELAQASRPGHMPAMRSDSHSCALLGSRSPGR